MYLSIRCARVGRLALAPIEYTLEVFFMFYESLRATALDQAQGARTILSVISAQIYFTGFQALPLISILALATGSVVMMQSTAYFTFFGGVSHVGDILVATIFREVAPLLTALIVIARSGTAVASEIGNMRVNREIEALEVMGIDPLSYVVFPRLIGGILSVVCLAFYFVVVAILGGFLVTQIVSNMSFGFYFDSLAQAFAKQDVALFLLKNVFSGAIIFANSCYLGMSVKNSSHEVPQMTTKAVMNSVIYVTVFNLAVTTLFYLSTLQQFGVL